MHRIAKKKRPFLYSPYINQKERFRPSWSAKTIKFVKISSMVVFWQNGSQLGVCVSGCGLSYFPDVVPLRSGSEHYGSYTFNSLNVNSLIPGFEQS